MSYYVYATKGVMKEQIVDMLNEYINIINDTSKVTKETIKNFKCLMDINKSIDKNYNTFEELNELSKILFELKKDIAYLKEVAMRELLEKNNIIEQSANYTVHFRYNTDDNDVGRYRDSVTFDDYETAMKYVNKKEAVYDYLDNYFEVREDETPLYITSDTGKVIWENENYVNNFVLDIIKGSLSDEEILTNLQIMQGMNHLNDFDIKVYGVGETLNASQLRRFNNYGSISYQINNVEFKSEDLELVAYKNNDIWRDCVACKTR